MADVAERPHAGDNRVEHGEKVAAKIILREKRAPLVLLSGSGRIALQQRQHPLAELIQQIPVVQRVFSNAFALLSHTPITPEWLNLYKLQLCCELLQLTTGSLQTSLLAMLCLPRNLSIKPADHNCQLSATFCGVSQSAKLSGVGHSRSAVTLYS
jgi:hypothetical protein